jgi:carboxypeptidase D
VKKALHVPVDSDWALCTGPVFVGEGGPEDLGDSSLDPIQAVLPRIIEATNRVLVYVVVIPPFVVVALKTQIKQANRTYSSNGAFDLDVLGNGTMLAIQNMTWNGQQGFQTAPNTTISIKIPDIQYQEVFIDSGFGAIDSPQGIMGIQHFERGLMWAETYLSGHMQPQFQPRSSYRHMQWLLGRIDAL